MFVSYNVTYVRKYNRLVDDNSISTLLLE
jgi:hypothetical protein